MTIAVEHKEELKKQIELQKADYFWWQKGNMTSSVNRSSYAVLHRR
jgi:hypothetical protein